MADGQTQEKEKSEGKPKGKGKLMIILAAVAVLGGGGFFAMNNGGDDDGAVQAVELGEMYPLGEFLVNLADGRTFCKAEITLHLAKDAHLVEESKGGHGKGGANDDHIRDAVNMVLSSKTLEEVSTVEGKNILKRELARAINEAAGHGSDHGSSDGEGKSEGESEGGSEKHSDWDSDTGPVLKVYFRSFATQR